MSWLWVLVLPYSLSFREWIDPTGATRPTFQRPGNVSLEISKYAGEAAAFDTSPNNTKLVESTATKSLEAVTRKKQAKIHSAVETSDESAGSLGASEMLWHILQLYFMHEKSRKAVSLPTGELNPQLVDAVNQLVWIADEFVDAYYGATWLKEMPEPRKLRARTAERPEVWIL